MLLFPVPVNSNLLKGNDNLGFSWYRMYGSTEWSTCPLRSSSITFLWAAKAGQYSRKCWAFSCLWSQWLHLLQFMKLYLLRWAFKALKPILSLLWLIAPWPSEFRNRWYVVLLYKSDSFAFRFWRDVALFKSRVVSFQALIAEGIKDFRK